MKNQTTTPANGKNAVIINPEKLMSKAQEHGFPLTNLLKARDAFNKASKTKLERGVSFAHVVNDCFTWYKNEGQTFFSVEGVKFSLSDLFDFIGLKKAMFYRLIQVANIPQEKVNEFYSTCDKLQADGYVPQRSINNLLSFAQGKGIEAKKIGEQTEQTEQTEGISAENVTLKPYDLIKLTFTRADGSKVSAKLNGSKSWRNDLTETELQQAISELKELLRGMQVGKETNDKTEEAALFAASGKGEQYLKNLQELEAIEEDYED